MTINAAWVAATLCWAVVLVGIAAVPAAASSSLWVQQLLPRELLTTRTTIRSAIYSPVASMTILAANNNYLYGVQWNATSAAPNVVWSVPTSQASAGQGIATNPLTEMLVLPSGDIVALHFPTTATSANDVLLQRWHAASPGTTPVVAETLTFGSANNGKLASEMNFARIAWCSDFNVIFALNVDPKGPCLNQLALYS